jgi:hypothetical protein
MPKIAGRQIQDGVIVDAHIAAGAGIVDSKLANGGEFIKRAGTVPMTGALNMGSQQINAVAAPSVGTDAVNRNYVDSAIAGLNSLFDSKPSVRVASTATVTVANPGTAVFDGVTLVANDRLLLKNQTAPQENGIYVFNGSGVALTRVTDMDAWGEVPGAFVAVEEGSANADTIWLCTSNAGGTLGTTAITWQQIPTTAGLLGSNFVNNETPTGLLNGSNVTYTLANTPVAGSEQVFINGVLQLLGAGNDYTISGLTITMVVAPLSTDVIRVSYRK